MKIKKFLSNKCIKLFTIIFIIVAIIFSLKVSFAYKNEVQLPIINPEWEVFNKLSEAEKANIGYIPMKYIINYDNTVNNSKNKISLFSRNIIPKSYDLRNINGVNTLGPVQNQGYSGLCWLFAMYSSLQSTIYTQHDENTLLSVAQYDFASSDRIREFLEYGIDNPYRYRKRFTGGNFSTGARFLTKGISPIDYVENSFMDNDVVSGSSISNNIWDVFDLTKVKYYVTDYDIMPRFDYDKMSNGTLTDYNNMIKQHILDYGAMLVGTYSPNENIGYCYHYNEKEDYHIINVDGNCGKSISNYKHQMTIVGWDDDFQYSYCQLTDSTISNLDNCSNVVSGKGAWILQNSWGENNTPYLYMTYDSQSVIEGGFTSVLKKDWENNYDVNKEIYNNYNVDNNSLEIKWVRTKDIKEVLNRLTFTTNVANAEYDIYFENGDGEFKYLTTVYKEYAGAYSIDLSNFGNDIIKLKGDSFSFKVELKNKIVSGITLIDDINVFTNYVNDIYEQTYEYVIKTKVFDNVYTNTDKIDIYSVTRNIPNGDHIQYRLFDSNNNEIIDNIDFSISLVLNNLAKNTLNISNGLDEGVYYLKAFYLNHEFDSYEFEVKNIVDFGAGGSGHINDPILISKAEDLLKIGTNDNYSSLSYKLINNIDLTNINWKPIGTKEEPFTGTFDGNNYIISNLKLENIEYGGLFGFTNSSEIKNIYLYDFIINAQNVGALVYKDNNSSIHDVYVNGGQLTGLSDVGGVIGNGNNGNYYNLVSNTIINAFSNYSGGIIANMTHSNLSTSISYSTLNLNNVFFSGGISGSAFDCILSNVASISDVSGSPRNFGGIVYELNGSINNAFVINNYNLNSTNNHDIVGHNYNSTDSINNVYYVNKFNKLPNLVLKNVQSFSKEDLKNKDTYLNFDFENIWRESDEYPELRFIDNKFYQKPEFIDESNYKINYINNIIYNVKSYMKNDKIRLLVEQFKNNFINFDGTIIDKNGVEIVDGEYIATGMKLLYKGKEYTISVVGDIFEDGVVSISDSVRLKQYLAGKISLNEAQLLSADTYYDDKINLTDPIIIQKNLAGIEDVKIYLEEGEY